MKKEFNAITNSFIEDYVNEVQQNTASLFVGAGLSKSAGYVDWKGLLKDIATELGLEIDDEDDLVSLAQYHKNQNQNRDLLNKKIVQEFVDDDLVDSPNHRILAKIPLQTIWTTNYDDLIEDHLEKYFKIPDVKSDVPMLFRNIPKRDTIIYKMHGDKDRPNDDVLTKEDYDAYYYTHENFLNLLHEELISKTFLFIGFSFTDPNLSYVLARLNHKNKKESKQHYCIMKSCSEHDFDNSRKFQYAKIKQDLSVGELKRYKIKTILIEKYSELTDILGEIENRIKRKTIFISGSAENYNDFSAEEAKGFLHILANLLVKNGFTVVNGFGEGVGSPVINGALDAIYSNNRKYSLNQLIINPFPQFATGSKSKEDLWNDYRNMMISQCGVALFLFGNKLDEKGEIINADGGRKEFEIAKQHHCFPITVYYNGSESSKIFDDIKSRSIVIENMDEDTINKIGALEFEKENVIASVEAIINLLKQI